MRLRDPNEAKPAPVRPWVVVATVLLLLATGLLSGCSGGTSPQLPMKLMPLGDSITEGYEVPGGYRIDLWKQLVQTDGKEIDFVGSEDDGPADLGDRDHEGHSGYRIDQIRAGIDDWLNRAQPDAVLLHIGTNDIFQGYELSTAPARVEDLVSRICVDRPQVQLSLASIVPVEGQEDKVSAFNDALPAVVDRVRATGCDVSFLNLNTVVSTAQIKDQHPTRTGFDEMAAAWLPVVSAMYDKFRKGE